MIVVTLLLKSIITEGLIQPVTNIQVQEVARHPGITITDLHPLQDRDQLRIFQIWRILVEGQLVISRFQEATLTLLAKLGLVRSLLEECHPLLSPMGGIITLPIPPGRQGMWLSLMMTSVQLAPQILHLIVMMILMLTNFSQGKPMGEFDYPMFLMTGEEPN